MALHSARLKVFGAGRVPVRMPMGAWLLCVVKNGRRAGEASAWSV